MSQDVLFKELEAIALKFALAEFQGDKSADIFSSVANISENSMKRAMRWHSEKSKRLGVIYSNPINRQDWEKIPNADITMPYLENKKKMLSEGQLYWVVPSIEGRGPIYAEFIGYHKLVAKFMNLDDSQDSFTIREIKIN